MLCLQNMAVKYSIEMYWKKGYNPNTSVPTSSKVGMMVGTRDVARSRDIAGNVTAWCNSSDNTSAAIWWTASLL